MCVCVCVHVCMYATCVLFKGKNRVVFEYQSDVYKRVPQLEPLPDSPVPVISDPTTIVTLPSEVCDGIQWNFLIFIDEHLKLAHADAQVGLIEPIDVPAQWAKLVLFLHQSMEEAQTEEKFLPYLRGRERGRGGRKGRREGEGEVGRECGREVEGGMELAMN